MEDGAAVKLEDVEIEDVEIEEETEEETEEERENREKRRRMVEVYGAAERGEQDLREVIRTVDVNTRNNTGRTALHLAAACGESESLLHLIKAGADVHIQHNRGETALHYGADSGNSQCVINLLQAGADINRPNNTGETPLFDAALYNHPHLVRLLLDCGAAPCNRDYIDRVRQEGHREVVTELLESAAKRGKVQMTVEKLKEFDFSKFFHKDNCREEYEEKDKSKLISTLNKKILVVGKQGSGKSSMCRTLAYFKQLTYLSDRTSVLELLNLVSKHKDGNTSVIYDVGGHDCYQYTTNIFAMNSPNNTIICTHDIADSSFRIPYSWLKSLLFKCHKCQWIFVLTKVDMYSESEVREKRKKFIRSMAVKLEKEIICTKANKAKVAADSNKYVAKQDDLENVIAACRRVKTSLESETGIFMISCKPLNLRLDLISADETKKLRKHLLEVIPSTVQLIPKVYHDFYTKLGTLGIRTPMEITSHQEPKDSDNEIETNSQEKNVKAIGAQKDPLKEAKTEGKTRQTEGKTQRQTKNEMPSTKTTTETRPLIYKERKEAEKLFQNLLKDAIKRKDITEEDAQLLSVDECIEHFHTVGVIFGFTSTPKQREIIYNDIATFVDMLKSIFNHKIYKANKEEDALTWDKLKVKEKERFESKADFTEATKALREKGFMYLSLLKLLLSKHQFDTKYDNLIDLFSSLYLCHQLNETGDIFFPFYCENIAVNAQTKKDLAWIATSDKKSLSVAIWMEGYISNVMYSKILVGLYKALGLRLDQKYVKIHVWGRGVFMWLGNVAISLICHIEKGMFVIFKASTTFSAVSSMWQAVNEFDNLVNEVIVPENPGAIINLLMLCSNCTALKESGKLIKIITEMACYKEENIESEAADQDVDKCVDECVDEDVDQEGASIAIDELFKCTLTLKEALSCSCLDIGTVLNSCKSNGNLNAVIWYPPQTGAEVKSLKEQEEFEQRLEKALENYPKEDDKKTWGKKFFGNIQQRSKDVQQSTTKDQMVGGTTLAPGPTINSPKRPKTPEIQPDPMLEGVPGPSAQNPRNFPQDSMGPISGFESEWPSDVPKLCGECLLKIADETIGLQPVINVLRKVHKGFCNHLSNDIITRDMREEISNTKNSSEALGLIRTALENSLVPDKLDIVIGVLREETPIHAEQIEKSYHEKIRTHKTCAKCGTEGKK